MVKLSALIIKKADPHPDTSPEKTAGDHDPRTRRTLVSRGGRRVEITVPARETR